MTCRFVDVERRNHGIATMCRALPVSRSGFSGGSRSGSGQEGGRAEIDCGCPGVLARRLREIVGAARSHAHHGQ